MAQRIALVTVVVREYEAAIRFYTETTGVLYPVQYDCPFWWRILCRTGLCGDDFE